MNRTRRGRVNLVVLGIGLAIIVPLLVLFAASFGNDPRAVPSVLEGGDAPAFRLVDLDGHSWSLDELEGQAVVLNFWSTWCGPCKIEHPYLQRAAQLYPDVQFLGVIYDDTPDTARRYLDRAGTTYPHLVDADGRVAIAYGVAGVPETFFVDRHGQVVYKHAGAVSEGLLAEMLSRIAREGGT